MLTFSSDPATATREMEGVLFYLTAFGYIDGNFDHREREFVEGFMERMAESQVLDRSTSQGRARRDIVLDQLNRAFENIDDELAAMWDEPTAEGEKSKDFVRSRIKLRCFEIFEGFGRSDRKVLLDAVDQLLVADGLAHPEELKFRNDLIALLDKERPRAAAAPAPEPGARRAKRRVVVHTRVAAPRTARNDPTLSEIEQHYAVDPETLRQQLEYDLELIGDVTGLLDEQREAGTGMLDGYHTVQELAGRQPFLDGHVHVIPPTHPAGYELLVLGDLHGCYSCLKGALMQTDFLGKVQRFARDPDAHAMPLLVLLGDYIDRGLYSYNGVLRAVLNLVATAPEHVIALRGNHEYYIEHEGEVFGGVRPAEAINNLKPHAPNEVFRAYRELFEAMPNMLLFDDVLFVHGGIPRDADLRERYFDLSSLNDPVLRFQMMWSDPSTADEVPDELQASSNRFAFGREQARAFLHQLGVRTLIRGHEKVNSGFEPVFDEPDLRLMTLFSAGGATNDDLPPRSSYRAVTPAALTIRYRDGELDIEPWAIDYESYNDPEFNNFFDSDAQLP